MPIAFVVEVADGKVRRWHSYYDSALMLQQLGLAPSPSSTEGAASSA